MLVWFLAHPAWAGVGGLLAIAALVVSLIDAPDGLDSATTPGTPGIDALPETKTDVETFLERFGRRLDDLGFIRAPKVKIVTPADFTDDTAQGVLNAAPEGSVIFLKRGSYRLRELKITKPLVILGEDALATRLVFTRWSITVRTPQDGPPAWLVNLTIDYAGNDYIMYSLEARGPTLVSYSRIEASSLFRPFLLIAIAGSLTVENSVLVSRPNAEGVLLVPITRDSGAVQVRLRSNSLVADVSNSIVTVSSISEAQPAPQAILRFEDNLMLAEETQEGPPPQFLQVTGGGEPHARFEFAGNVFAGWQRDSVEDVMLGRRDSDDMYMPRTSVDRYYYPTVEFAEIAGPIPIGAH